MAKNTYTDEFKTDAVRLYEDTEGASFSSIAVDLGISRATLKNWVYASRTVKDMELGPKATTAKNAVSDFVSEVSNLAKGTFKK